MSVARTPADIFREIAASGMYPPPWVVEAEAIVRALEGPAPVPVMNDEERLDLHRDDQHLNPRRST